MDARDAESRVRALVHAWATAVHIKDAAAVLRHYAPEVVSFGLAPPLVHEGADRKGLEGWFETWRGRIGLEVTDLHVTTDGELAFARSLNRISGTKTDGEVTTVWVRATFCFQRLAGDWKIVHEHSSVPFYMDGSERAATDLQP